VPSKLQASSKRSKNVSLLLRAAAQSWLSIKTTRLLNELAALL
jgi:hypothetical protein